MDILVYVALFAAVMALALLLRGHSKPKGPVQRHGATGSSVWYVGHHGGHHGVDTGGGCDGSGGGV